MKLTFTKAVLFLAAVGSANAACCEMASNPRLCGFRKRDAEPVDVSQMKGGALLGSREALICCCSASTCPPDGGCAV
ncbi:hypothetical protein BC629DRAFT_1461245, partial [Irpex lacteus]